MAFTTAKHLEADLLREKISQLQQSKSEFLSIKDELTTNKKHSVSLVYTYNDVAKQINISENETASNSLIDSIISDLDLEIISTQTDYANIGS